jgi:hypothetical protein
METRIENARTGQWRTPILPNEDADAGMTELQSFLSHASLEAGRPEKAGTTVCSS